jgi:hypothetical protein
MRFNLEYVIDLVRDAHSLTQVVRAPSGALSELISGVLQDAAKKTKAFQCSRSCVETMKMV